MKINLSGKTKIFLLKSPGNTLELASQISLNTMNYVGGIHVGDAINLREDAAK